MNTHRMYGDLAEWWPLLSPAEDYAEEAESFINLFKAAGLDAGASCLELGCGGGHNAVHMKGHFAEMTLTDLSPEMITMSEQLNPECTHQIGDMRDVRLGRTFDAVFVHDAIEYMTSRDDLARTLETVWEHLRPGGIAVLAPDGMRDDFEEHTEHGGSDLDGRAMRYFEWVYDPDESDATTVTDYVFLIREPGKPVQVIHEQHTTGHFFQSEWHALLDAQGFEYTSVMDAWERRVFTLRKPAG